MAYKSISEFPLINNIHECRRYILSLNRDYDISMRRIDFTSISDINYFIKKEMALICNGDVKQAESIFKKLKKEYKDELITEDDLGVLLTEDRVNFYTWLLFMSDIEVGAIKLSHIFPETQTQALNKKERGACILGIFDGWTIKKEIKLKKVDDIKKSFTQKLNDFKQPLNWLNKKDKEQCEWAFNYTLNHLKKHISTYTPNLPYIWLKHLTPISSNEHRDCTIAAFDCWPANFEMKKIFLININKAWNQQKQREKLKNKKAINTYIDEKSKEKLDQLSEKNNMTLNKMIEYLIDKEFKLDSE